MMQAEGIVNVLKPPGMTSSNVVSDVRKLFGLKRVGHTGTLDPGAAGVLPICLGRATRLFDFLVDKEKEYIAEIAFGTRTDTQDSYGHIVERDDVHITSEQLNDALPAFLGAQQQIAPAYSALKSEGKALYELARSGQEVPERIRRITVHALELLDQTDKGRFLLRIRCSRGTYVRTLCEDIGRNLGTCSHMSFLLRTASGEFRVENAHSIQELSDLRAAGKLQEAVISTEQAVDFLPAIHISDAAEVFRLQNGCTAELPENPVLCENTYCRVYGENFLGVGVSAPEGLKLKLHLESCETE